MIPSDHFVRFYNEVFKFLDEKHALPKYYQEISRHQERHCLELFTRKGLQGMYEYWDHIRVEENCEVEIDLIDDGHHFFFYMNRCPSLSKVMDNDAGACHKYCLHCPGWVLPLMTKCGYYYIKDLVGLDIPRCHMDIFDNREMAVAWKQKLLKEGRPASLIVDNIDDVKR